MSTNLSWYHPVPKLYDFCAFCEDRLHGRPLWGKCFCDYDQRLSFQITLAYELGELDDDLEYLPPTRWGLWKFLWDAAPPRNSFELILLFIEWGDYCAARRRVRKRSK